MELKEVRNRREERDRERRGEVERERHPLRQTVCATALVDWVELGQESCPST